MTVADFHRGVDVLDAGDAALDHLDCLQTERDPDRDEAKPAVADDACLDAGFDAPGVDVIEADAVARHRRHLGDVAMLPAPMTVTCMQGSVCGRA